MSSSSSVFLLSLFIVITIMTTETVDALPSYAHSCTENFSGGDRLPHPYCDPSLSIEERVRDLVPRLTYEEKCLLTSVDQPTVPRLGLPSLKTSESTHGVSTGCGVTSSPNSTGCPTSFPTGLGLGAAFHRDLWKDVGRIIGMEGRGLNNQGSAGNVTDPPKDGISNLYFVDPNINLCRDPRWGRCMETPGEDPILTKEYAVAIIKATQYEEDVSKYMMAAATAKHWTMYDLEGKVMNTKPPASGHCDNTLPGGSCTRFNFDMTPPDRDYQDYYLVPFKAAVQEAHVQSLMCAYTAGYDVPMCANKEAQDLVRNQWKWDGVIISDYTAVELMGNEKWENCEHPWPSEGGSCTPDPFPGGHGYTNGPAETIRVALEDGGVDIDFGSIYRTNCYNSFQDGKISKESLDEATYRLYKTHFKLGMMDPIDHQPYVKYGPEVVDSAQSREVALRAARESLVLLKNKGNLLPLSAAVSQSTMAIIGPHATSTVSLLANYHGANKLVESHSPLDVAQRRAAAGTFGGFTKVVYSQGCRICDYPHGQNPGYPNQVCPPGKDQNKSGIPTAVAAAQSADVAVLFVGLDETSEAESFDRKHLGFPGVQEDLINQVLAVQPNTVIVLIHGGGISSPLLKESAPAVLDAFYPGELGSDAIMDALVGDYNPGGKLPYTVYNEDFIARDIRVTDLQADGGVTYQWFQGPVLFPFGYGLSYTSFQYTLQNNASLPSTITTHDLLSMKDLPFQVLVKNTGSVAGDAVVLGFTNAIPDHTPVDMPRRRLFDFHRVHLLPGASSTVQLLADGSFLAKYPGQVVMEVGDIERPAVHHLNIVE